MPAIHIVGAGLAGLATGVSLVKSGHEVSIYEASGQAGGRCRSFVDAKLNRTIDNGNHLLLSGNKDAMRYLASIGASDELIGPASAWFPFLDVRTGKHWRVWPNRGRFPWWILSPGRRVPDTSVWNYLSALKFAVAGPERTVTDCIGDQGVVFERLWEPLAVAALNTPASTGAARLFWPVLRETFAKGETECLPRIAKHGLSSAFVDPALKLLEQHNSPVQLGLRLRRIEFADGYASHLDFGQEKIELATDDCVVLALPPAATGALLPRLDVPQESHAIVNTHFRLSEPPRLEEDLPFLGLIGGTAQWLFVRDDIASTTVSAADELANEPTDVIAAKVWCDVAVALGASANSAPSYRIVKEKRATFAQTPREIRKRPDTRSGIANLYLAGDWINTDLPATIEGAIRSGNMAARAVAKDRSA